MARVKISEYKAKQLLYNFLNISPEFLSCGISDNLSQKLDKISKNKRYVVKLDQGIKGRFKKGLIALDKSSEEILPVIKNFQSKRYTSFLIEEFVNHEKDDEYYISIERVREGKRILYSKNGGIDIEKNQDKVKSEIIKNNTDIGEISDFLNLEKKVLINILKVFDKYFFSFLEINPLITTIDSVHLLDLAVEVDSAAEFFVDHAWTSSDFILDEKQKTQEEKEVLELSAKSQAAFKLDVINKNGSIFMLLSGGGASIVLADEVQVQGFASELANYGEYSGNPSQEETYIYAKNLLSLLIKSKANKKILIIGGGVANFTDVRITFKGIIEALTAVRKELEKQNVKIFVRRGGPHQKVGLEIMENFLIKQNLLGKVVGPEIVLTDIVIDGLNYIKND